MGRDPRTQREALITINVFGPAGLVAPVVAASAELRLAAASDCSCEISEEQDPKSWDPLEECSVPPCPEVSGIAKICAG